MLLWIIYLCVDILYKKIIKKNTRKKQLRENRKWKEIKKKRYRGKKVVHTKLRLTPIIKPKNTYY